MQKTESHLTAFSDFTCKVKASCLHAIVCQRVTRNQPVFTYSSNQRRDSNFKFPGRGG